MEMPTISHYRLLRSLGAGAHGDVHLAQHTQLDMKVAIKSLRPELLQSHTARQRFLREAEAISQIDHPNVVVLHDVVEEPNGLHLVMQYVEGESLRDRLEHNNLDLPTALRIISEIADGLSAAHSHGIVHRDLKPANVLLGGNGCCKIADFGLAHFYDRTTLRLEHGLVGTPAYMAPEQRQGEEVDQRADIYALGRILEEVLAQCGHVPRRLRKLVERATAPAPAERFANAEEFKAQLNPSRPHAGARVAIALSVLLLASLWPTGKHLFEPRAPAQWLRVVVAPFTNSSQEQDLDWLSTGMMDNLIGSLATLPGLRMVSRHTVGAALGDASSRGGGLDSQRLEDLVRRMDADYLISGSFAPNGQGLRLHCELVDSHKSEVVASWPLDLAGPEFDVLVGVEDIVRSVAMALELPIPSLESKATKQTSSLAALKHFEEGMQHHLRADTGRAVTSFRSAIAADSTYARAYLMLWENAADPKEADWAIQQAMRYRHGQAAPLPGLIEASHADHQDNDDEAIRRYQALLAQNPDEFDVREELAHCYLDQRRWADAVGEIGAARRLNPYDFSMLGVLALSLVESGHTRKARVVLLNWRRERPIDPAPLTSLIAFSWWTGDYQRSLAYADSLAALQPGADLGHRAVALQFLGEASEAEAALREWIAREEPDNRYMTATPLVMLAQLELVRGHLAQGEGHIRQALLLQDNYYARWVAGKLSVARGDLRRAHTHAEAIANDIPGDPADSTVSEALAFRRWYCDVAGSIALAEGNIQEAIRWHRLAKQFSGRIDAGYFATPLGIAYLAAGDTAQAEAAFRAALVLNVNFYPPRLQLGRIALARQDVNAAHAVLDPLLALWQQADPDFPPNQELRTLGERLRELETAQFRSGR